MSDDRLQQPSDTFTTNITNHLAAIRLCMESHLRMPALVLIYTGVDIISALTRPANVQDAGRREYIRWAEKYMQPRTRLGVGGIDLYAARCGIIHTYTADARLIRDGEAKRIIYCWGNRTGEDQNALLRTVGWPVVMVSIDSLLNAFCDGIAQQVEELASQSQHAQLIQERARKFFGDRESFPGLSDFPWYTEKG